MTRIRLSTTVNAALLEDARRVRSGVTDAALIDAALEALLARHRDAELDASYAAYDDHPQDEPDEWETLHPSARLQQRRELTAGAGRGLMVRDGRDWPPAPLSSCHATRLSRGWSVLWLRNDDDSWPGR